MREELLTRCERTQTEMTQMVQTEIDEVSISVNALNSVVQKQDKHHRQSQVMLKAMYEKMMGKDASAAVMEIEEEIPPVELRKHRPAYASHRGPGGARALGSALQGAHADKGECPSTGGTRGPDPWAAAAANLPSNSRITARTGPYTGR